MRYPLCVVIVSRRTIVDALFFLGMIVILQRTLLCFNRSHILGCQCKESKLGKLGLRDKTFKNSWHFGCSSQIIQHLGKSSVLTLGPSKHRVFRYKTRLGSSNQFIETREIHGVSSRFLACSRHVWQEMQDMALDFLDPAYYGISVGQAETAIPVIYDASYSFEMLKIQKSHILWDIIRGPDEISQ